LASKSALQRGTFDRFPGFPDPGNGSKKWIRSPNRGLSETPNSGKSGNLENPRFGSESPDLARFPGSRNPRNQPIWPEIPGFRRPEFPGIRQNSGSSRIPEFVGEFPGNGQNFRKNLAIVREIRAMISGSWREKFAPRDQNFRIPREKFSLR